MRLMDRRDVSKQNVPALSYAATRNINDAAYITEVLEGAFCRCYLPRSVCPLNVSWLCFTSLWWQPQISCPAGGGEILSLSFQPCA